MRALNSILVGAGRFEEFRLWSSPLSTVRSAAILWIDKDDLTLIGAGRDLTHVGPATFTERQFNVQTGSMYVEKGVSAEVRGMTFDNTSWPGTLYGNARVVECRFLHPEGSTGRFGMIVESTEGALVSNCEFIGQGGIITGPARNLVIEDCMFDEPGQRDNAIVIGNGAKECAVRRCIIRRAAVGIQFDLGGTGWVEDTVIESARVVGISMSYGSAIVRRCRIGVTEQPISLSQGRLEVYDSILEGGTLATIFGGSQVVIMRNNHILNVGGMSVKTIGVAPNDILDLRENWWGTSDPVQVASWIDDSYGVTTWLPILLGPVPTEATTIGELKASFGID